MTRLFHLIDPDTWRAAEAAGEYRPSSLDAEGFVHFSFAEQVEPSANKHYAEAAALCVLEIDADAVTHDLRVEDSYGSGAHFPHVYGPIDPRWVVAVHPIARDEDGRWRFSRPA